MNKIRQNIYLGSHRDAQIKSLLGKPITAILNLTPDVAEPGGTYKFVRIAMRDNAAEVHKHTDYAVEVLNKLLDAGEIVLVHCRQGRSRSPHIVAECLALREKRDYFDVYKEIRTLRPEVMQYSIGEEIVDLHHRSKL